VTPKVHGQSPSHAGLLIESGTASAHAWFDAIVMPTHRPVEGLPTDDPVAGLRSCIVLAQQANTPLIVMCSKGASKRDVYRLTEDAKVKVFAFDLDDRSRDPLRIGFHTTHDAELSAASPGWNRDLSAKRNIGLVLARLLGWSKLMFLDDDIYGVKHHHVAALAAALEDHNVSALIPTRYPDNSVVCHAHRLGGGEQDVFASASGMGVRCDRDGLAFFPDVYNEDWFFFADEAANHRIARVGESRQWPYDPYDSPGRAAWEEFGDLLAEGLYARLDVNEGVWDVDVRYWRDFIEQRRDFHQQVAESLMRVDDEHREEAAKAVKSISAAQDQLDMITPELCMKFMRSWQRDSAKWHLYLASLPALDSIEAAFDFLGIDYRPEDLSAPAYFHCGS
jgi:hypothetical protein